MSVFESWKAFKYIGILPRIHHLQFVWLMKLYNGWIPDCVSNIARFHSLKKSPQKKTVSSSSFIALESFSVQVTVFLHIFPWTVFDQKNLSGSFKYGSFSSLYYGEMIQFDFCIFFRWVVQPPTRNPSTWRKLCGCFFRWPQDVAEYIVRNSPCNVPWIKGMVHQRLPFIVTCLGW